MLNGAHARARFQSPVAMVWAIAKVRCSESLKVGREAGWCGQLEGLLSEADE